jgi:parallel beta-helix repeat protein
MRCSSQKILGLLLIDELVSFKRIETEESLKLRINSMESKHVKNEKLAIILLLVLSVSLVSFTSMTQLRVAQALSSSEYMVISQGDSPLEIASNAELAVASTSGVGTRSDPYIIEGKTIHAVRCIYIRETTAFFTLRNSELRYDDSGGGGYSGVSVVRFERVEHGTIENCYVRGGDIAIEMLQATDCTIKDCTVLDAYTGILVDSSSNCTVVESSSFGNAIGTMIFSSDSCNIINSSVYANSERGVHVEVFCENNTIYGNSIGWNNDHNAIDNGNNTIFSDSINTGNRWTDLVIGEEYIIEGSANSVDPFPALLSDPTSPVIWGVSDIVLDVESNGDTLTWRAEDEFHSHYQIYVNTRLEVEEVWDGNEIIFPLDELPLGTHTIILNVTDGAGNYGRDEVIVSVISFILGGIGTEYVMIASGVTVAVFVTIILILKRFG